MADANEVLDTAVTILAGLTAVTASVVFIVKLSQMLKGRKEEAAL